MEGFGHGDALIGEEGQVAHVHRGAVKGGSGSAPGEGLEVLGRVKGNAALLGRSDDSPSQGMLRPALDRRRMSEHLVGGAPAPGDHISDGGLTPGEGPRLVEHHHDQSASCLKVGAALEEHPVARGVADGTDDAHWR